jgi:hypothetical protein
MRDRFALPLLALVALAMIVLALMWPQGQGAPSPAPFDHPMSAPEGFLTAGGRTIGAIRGAQDAPAAVRPPP